MNENKYYKLLNDFAVRMPALPVNDYENIQIKDITKNIYFKEAIKVASPSLYETIEKNKFNSSVNSAVMKYYSRIANRTTPFGLFSGISIGEFDEKTTASYNEDNFNKRIRVDYEWLVKVIKKIEIDCKGYKKALLYTSRNVYEYGNKIENPIITCFNHYKTSESYHGKCFINNKANVRFILGMLKNGAKCCEIQESFEKKGLKVPDSALDNILEELIKNEYIYTEIRPSMSESNLLGYIINKIEGNDLQIDFLEKLQEIDLLIKKYNCLKTAEGISILNDIEDLMESIVESKSYIQVDLANPFKINLGKNIEKEVNELVNFLACFSERMHVKDSLTIFKEQFEEKYGHYREVSLLEAIDPTYGIGYEEDKNEEDNQKYLYKERLKNNFIKRKIIESIKNNSDVILTDDDINEGIEKFKNEKLPDSIELNLTILSDSIEEINNNNYKLKIAPNFGSLGAGKSVGRFYDILKDSSSLYEKVKNKENELLSNDFIKCELISMDMDSRSTNVSIANNFRDFQVNITNLPLDGSKPNIEISDIYIGLENESLYLKSKKYNKKIIVTTNHMLNTLRASKVCKLLRDISEGYNTINPFALINYIDMMDLDYTPRVIYKKTILTSKSWRIRKLDFNLKHLTYDSFYKRFYELQKKYNIPNLLYIKSEDLLLFIDLKLDVFKEILFNEFNKDNRSVIVLQEAYLNNAWISNNGECYANECVFQLIKSREDINNIKNISDIYPTVSKYKDNRNNTLDYETRNFGIFDEWIYLKIYHNKSRTKEILTKEIRDLINTLKDQKIISKWFYLQYKEDKHHIRLRLKINDVEKNYVQALKLVKKIQKDLTNLGLAEKITIDAYEREIERYGGVRVIEEVEDVFEKQSSMALEYMKLNNLSKDTMINEIEFGVMVLINLMNYLDIDYETQLNIFNAIINKDFMRKEFSVDRKKYIYLYNKYNNQEEESIGDSIGKIIFLSKDSVNKLGTIINKVDIEGELTNSKLDILLSLMHMFCNRLYGIDAQKEKKVLAFVRHTLYSVRYFKLNKDA